MSQHLTVDRYILSVELAARDCECLQQASMCPPRHKHAMYVTCHTVENEPDLVALIEEILLCLS